jgi:hypothetical protein
MNTQRSTPRTRKLALCATVLLSVAALVVLLPVLSMIGLALLTLLVPLAVVVSPIAVPLMLFAPVWLVLRTRRKALPERADAGVHPGVAPSVAAA